MLTSSWPSNKIRIIDAKQIRESNLQSLRSAGWSWRLELKWCERKILLDWLEPEPELELEWCERKILLG